MSSGFKWGFLSLVVVLILIALIQAAQKSPIDWRYSYDPKAKIPYGTYVLFRELGSLFPDNKEITEIDQSLYTFLSYEAPADHSELLFVGQEFNPGEAALGELLAFVHSGHRVFISSRYLAPKLEDTLGIATATFRNGPADIDPANDSTFLSPGEAGKPVYLDKATGSRVFCKLHPGTRILGYFHRGTVAVPDFIEVTFGRGKLFLHLEPLVFTNYYMLQQQSFGLASRALHHLQGKHILWYDGLFSLEQEHSPLRFILNQPALRWAWYLLLLCLVLYLIFKSKREQRAVPVVDPEPNLSVAFAETIGSLYYENSKPGNMAQKKIAYFLFVMRRKLWVDTADLTNPKLISLLSQRSGMSESEIEDFLHILDSYREREHYSVQDLKYLNHLILSFKQKLKLI